VVQLQETNAHIVRRNNDVEPDLQERRRTRITTGIPLPPAQRATALYPDEDPYYDGEKPDEGCPDQLSHQPPVAGNDSREVGGGRSANIDSKERGILLMSKATLPDANFWQELGWQPTKEQGQQLIDLQDRLREWNTKVNLTRLVEDNDFWINQIFDSLWPLQEELKTADRPRQCIDVGTGGGFPGLAAAIALPNSQFTLVDSVGRKTAAVESIAEELGLGQRITVRTERIEETGQLKQCRAKFDLAMARAVAAAPIVAEYLAPLIHSTGQALLYRGHWNDEQQRDLSRAAHILKTKITTIQKTELPDARGVRHVLRLSPVGTCPKAYPRAVGIPSKVPLP